VNSWFVQRLKSILSGQMQVNSSNYVKLGNFVRDGGKQAPLENLGQSPPLQPNSRPGKIPPNVVLAQTQT